MQSKAIIFLLACFFCNDCRCQQYPFIHYSPKDGMINNRTRMMYQDSKGLLYIATYGGLSVYDGSRFTNYTTDNGLPTNTVNDVIEMGNDSIWIVPNAAGINCMVNGRLSRLQTNNGFYPVINKMFRSSYGSYYALADEGLFRFEKNLFTRIPLRDADGRDAGGFFKNAVEQNEKLFLLTDANVQPAAGPGRLMVYSFKDDEVIMSRNLAAYFLVIAPDGNILVSTKLGIKAMDKKALQENKIRFVPLSRPYQAAAKLVASYMYFDNQQNLWLCSSGGVIKIDRQGNVKKFNSGNGLTTDNQSSVFQDKENTMWFTNEQTGISKLVNAQFEFYYRLKPGFQTTDIFAQNSTDSVWFLDGVNNRLLLQSNNKLKEFNLVKPPISPPYHFFFVSGHRYYLTDLFNIYECRFLSGDNVGISLIHNDPTLNVNSAYSCLQSDNQGNLLLSSETITVLQPNKKIVSYPLGYFADAFKVTSKNRLWVATRGQNIFEFSIHADSARQYLKLLNTYNKGLPEMSPRSITVDQSGNVWVGSRDNGLFCLFFDSLRRLKSWKQITTKDGMSDNFINYLHADSENCVWACSQGGLDKIRIKNGNYLIENITRSNNVYQYISKVQTSKGNVHWVVTAGGVIKINRDSSLPTHFLPAIMLRTIDEGNERIDVRAGPVSLSYKQNNLRFSMAVPSFIDEGPIRYSYKLEGSGERKWSEPSSQTVINFAGLSPGVYTLKAKASFINGRYEDSETSFSFSILPPWWQREWFRGLILFLALGLLIYVVRSYYQGKLKKQRFEIEKKEAIKQERTRIATDMHDDLGAGLARIRFLSESIRRKNPDDPSFLPEITKISSYSDEMIEKMGEIVWAMNEKNDTMADLFAFTRSYSADYLQNHGIDYKIELPPETGMLLLNGEARRTIFLAVKESLFNIVKHAHATRVNIRFQMNDGLDIEIRDNGQGIDLEKLRPHGNGLLNIRNRIQSIKGRVEILNENGTVIKFSIPVEKA
jgi:signal transduction histidine kinase/ligand-binding sensor domain-containing protein